MFNTFNSFLSEHKNTLFFAKKVDLNGLEMKMRTEMKKIMKRVLDFTQQSSSTFEFKALSLPIIM